MLSFLLALSVATVLTALFMFRFAAWKRPRVVAVVFLVLLAAEWAAEIWLIPEGVFGMGLVVICFALSIPFLIGSWLCWRAEQDEDEKDCGAS